MNIYASIWPYRRSISATNAHFPYLAKGRLETRGRTLLTVYTACKFRSRGRELSMCLRVCVYIRSIKYNMGGFIWVALCRISRSSSISLARSKCAQDNDGVNHVDGVCVRGVWCGRIFFMRARVISYRIIFKMPKNVLIIGPWGHCFLYECAIAQSRTVSVSTSLFMLYEMRTKNVGVFVVLECGGVRRASCQIDYLHGIPFEKQRGGCFFIAFIYVGIWIVCVRVLYCKNIINIREQQTRNIVCVMRWVRLFYIHYTCIYVM